MKKLLALFLALLTLTSIFAFSANAAEKNGAIYSGSIVDVEYLDNGDYVVTVIEGDDMSLPGDSTQATTVTKTKASNYYSSSGALLWCVKVQGNFTYDGKTAKCNSSAHQVLSYAQTWSIVSASNSKSGNKATATATMRHNLNPGYSDYTRSVTLTCSPTGVFS